MDLIMTDTVSHIIDITTSNAVPNEVVDKFYPQPHLQTVLNNTLQYIQVQSVTLPYYAELDTTTWLSKPKQLGVYLTDSNEGRELNLEARGKDYATNILSYPSDLPEFILTEMDQIPIGELIICHEVVERQANEQNKTVADHATHLLVHGILHLLGFDHELGAAEQEEMEGFEIEILEKLGINNPYVDRTK